MFKFNCYPAILTTANTMTLRGDTGVEIQAQELKAGMYIYSLMADGKSSIPSG